MRMRSWLGLLAVMAFLAGALPGQGQFQQPTPEELKMTSDPKAPGADAVYLYREETTDDTLHFHRYYERIKVLTEKGKELATIRTPYEHGRFTVNDIQGRTIHADGTIVPLTAKPTDLMDFKNKSFQVNTMVFTLPSVEVGSILEYRLSIRYDDSVVSEPTWDIQQRYFVHKAHYYFKPLLTPGRFVVDDTGSELNRLMFTHKIDSDAKVTPDRQNAYSLDVTDVPPIPDEDWMPPLNTLEWRVGFYYTSFATGGEFWEKSGKRWAKNASDFTNPTSALKNAVAGIVAPGDTDQVKATKIYDAVMKLNNTSFARKKSEAERKKEKLKQIKNAEDVWKEQGGSDDEIALLYVALGRAAGLKVWPLQVTDRSRAIFDIQYLSISQLDDYLAMVEIDGKRTYLDPGQKMCPYGHLHWKHAMATGFLLTDKGPVAMSTPQEPYSNNVLKRVAVLNVDEAGAVTGTARIIMAGADALLWRQRSLENDPEEIKKQFDEAMRDRLPEGVRGEFDHFLAMDDYNANLIAIFKVSGNLGSATGKRYFVPAAFFESRAQHPFVTLDKRTAPIDVRYAKFEQDDVTYNLPSGYSVESVPEAVSNSWPQHASLKLASTKNDASVNMLRTLVYNFVLLDAKEYPNLHDFYQKVASADQQQIVLTRAAATKGD